MPRIPLAMVFTHTIPYSGGPVDSMAAGLKLHLTGPDGRGASTSSDLAAAALNAQWKRLAVSNQKAIAFAINGIPGSANGISMICADWNTVTP